VQGQFQDRLFCAMGRAQPAPQVQRWPSAGASRDSFSLLHNDLAFLPAHHDGRLGFTGDGGGLLLRPAQMNWPFPLGLAGGRPAAPISPGVLAPFEQCGNRKCANKSRLM